MKSDPMDRVTTTTINQPPSHGPGSGKTAWIAYAGSRNETCDLLFEIVDEQSATIRDLQAEVALLRDQIATRKPKGGRPKLADQIVNRIERDLNRGLSQRQAARHHGVSAMTVSRIAARMKERA